jgi:hypothetical protein
MKTHKLMGPVLDAGTRGADACKRFFAMSLRVALGMSWCAAVLALGVNARGADSKIYSIVTNPGEDCSSQMNIGWHADLGCSNCFVSYTKKSDAAWAHAVKVPGTYEHCDVFDGVLSKTAAGADVRENAVFLDYGATLQGLERDTEYMYQVCGNDGARSQTYHFKTAGAAEFSFIWIGDFHTYAPLPGRLRNAVKVLEAARAIDPGVDFVFSTGDVLAWGGSYSFWTILFEQDFIREYMFANVLGNHDNMTRNYITSPAYFRAAHNLPRNGYAGQEGVCCWFIYQNVLFITLNNEAMSTKPEGEAAAKKWAAEVISRLKGRYRYILLCEHYQWFDGRSGKTSWYAHWKDFCDEHGVALALSGNNHIYERTRPLCHDRVVAEGKGTVYMEVPSSDGERGVEAGTLTQNTEKLAYTYSGHPASGGRAVRTIGCVLVKVDAERMATKLVYIDEQNHAQFADEHAARALLAH